MSFHDKTLQALKTFVKVYHKKDSFFKKIVFSKFSDFFFTAQNFQTLLFIPSSHEVELRRTVLESCSIFHASCT